ncbi:hypothetical protein HRG_013876 [Hirsutella rhossiliensis]
MRQRRTNGNQDATACCGRWNNGPTEEALDHYQCVGPFKQALDTNNFEDSSEKSDEQWKGIVILLAHANGICLKRVVAMALMSNHKAARFVGDWGRKDRCNEGAEKKKVPVSGACRGIPFEIQGLNDFSGYRRTWQVLYRVRRVMPGPRSTEPDAARAFCNERYELALEASPRTLLLQSLVLDNTAIRFANLYRVFMPNFSVIAELQTNEEGRAMQLRWILKDLLITVRSFTPYSLQGSE